MLLTFILICLACFIMQQVQLWQLRKSLRRVTNAAVDFLEARPYDG